MRLTPQQENARTLAALLGVEEEDAAERLKLRVAVTADPSESADCELAQHVIAMLSRTVAWAGPADGGPFAAEIVIGARAPEARAPATVWAGAVGSDFVVSADTRLETKSVVGTPRPLLVADACYTAAAGVRAALGPSFPIRAAEPVVLQWQELLGGDPNILRQPVDIGEAFLAGAGAIGNGFLYALRYFDLSGTLYVIDPKRVNSGGLNRCLLVSEDDVGQPKASRLCQAVQSAFPKLRLIPSDTSLADARNQRGKDYLIDRLVVAVDSRGARRSLQGELPRVVFDASTTDVREVVLHFNRQPTELACLSCVYPHNERERRHEENIAAAFGLTIDEVRAEFCTRETAEKICCLYLDARVDDLVGRAFDTMYKELCGAGKLNAADGRQVLAPFSFVSVLAGAQLAIEFLLRSLEPEATRFNYWRLSPWHSPIVALRQQRPRDPSCEFCGNSVIRRELARLFGG